LFDCEILVKFFGDGDAKGIMWSMKGGRARNDFSLALAIQEQHCGDHKERRRRSNRRACIVHLRPPEYPIIDRGIARTKRKLILFFSRSSSKALFNFLRYG
jgi:hypothetical protein